MNFADVVLQAGVTFLGALGGSWLVLSQHKQKAWWESKRNIYTELIESFLICIRRSNCLANEAYHFDERQNPVAPPDDDEIEGEFFNKAIKRIREISLTGEYFVGSDAAQLLRDCVHEYEGTLYGDMLPF